MSKGLPYSLRHAHLSQQGGQTGGASGFLRFSASFDEYVQFVNYPNLAYGNTMASIKLADILPIGDIQIAGIVSNVAVWGEDSRYPSAGYAQLGYGTGNDVDTRFNVSQIGMFIVPQVEPQLKTNKTVNTNFMQFIDPATTKDVYVTVMMNNAWDNPPPFVHIKGNVGFNYASF